MYQDGYYNHLSFEPERTTVAAFNPHDFIKPADEGYAHCTNPMADGGLSAITVSTKLRGEMLKNFEDSVKRMVLAKIFSPKFGEVILTATRLEHQAA